MNFIIRRLPPLASASTLWQSVPHCRVERERIICSKIQSHFQRKRRPCPAVAGNFLCEFDDDNAKLLAAAGFEKGLTINADITVGSFPSDNLIYQSVKSDLAKVGVTLNYTTITFAQWLPQYNANSWKGEAFGLSWNSAPRGDASRPYAIFVCKPVGAFYCNAEEDALVKKASTELNAAKRLAILKEIAVKVTASAPALYIVEQIDLYAVGKGVKGFSAANRLIAYENVYVK